MKYLCSNGLKDLPILKPTNITTFNIMHTNTLAHLLLATLLALPTTLSAQKTYSGTPERLFTTYDAYGVPYRIPAITTTKKGHLIAVADRRYCGFDIGFGRIDMVARTSRNNGHTWSADTVIQRGSGIDGADDCGYGDAAIVADRNSKRVLCMSVTGCTPYIKGTRARPNRIARWYSPDGGRSWTKAEDVTNTFYAMLPNTRTMFIGSGRIMQSRVVKKDKYYRLYCSVLTRTQMGDKDVACNYVLYSDDFGQTWAVLGGTTLDGMTALASRATSQKLRSYHVGMSFYHHANGMAVSLTSTTSTTYVSIRSVAVGAPVLRRMTCPEASRWEPIHATVRLCL